MTGDGTKTRDKRQLPVCVQKKKKNKNEEKFGRNAAALTITAKHRELNRVIAPPNTTRQDVGAAYQVKCI